MVIGGCACRAGVAGTCVGGGQVTRIQPGDRVLVAALAAAVVRAAARAAALVRVHLTIRLTARIVVTPGGGGASGRRLG
jgi:hypothetical protein